MAIPDFQSVMLPVLQQLADKKEYKRSELIAPLADKFKLTEEEKAERHEISGVFSFWRKNKLGCYIYGKSKTS